MPGIGFRALNSSHPRDWELRIVDKIPNVPGAWVHKGTHTPSQGVGTELERNQGVGNRDWKNPEA